MTNDIISLQAIKEWAESFEDRGAYVATSEDDQKCPVAQLLWKAGATTVCVDKEVVSYYLDGGHIEAMPDEVIPFIRELDDTFGGGQVTAEDVLDIVLPLMVQ